MKFEPISYDHAASLIGRSPWEVSRDADLLAAAHQQAMKTYGCEGCVVGIDIYNVEAEIYGCEIVEPGGNGVPTAGEPILSGLEQIMPLQLDPSQDGRIPMILEAAEKIARDHPGAEVRIPLSGPFSIASHLLGMENMIIELFTNPEATEAALMHLAGNQLAYVRAAVEKGFSISLFESSVTPPLLSPQMFADSVAPALEKILKGSDGHPRPDSQLIIGGDTVEILGAMSSLSPAYIICPVETDQEEFMSRVIASQQMTVRINMNPAVLLPGKEEAAMAEAKRVLDLAGRYDHTSTGTLIPFDADPEIVKEVADFIRG